MTTPDDEQLWDPERLRVVGKLFRSYSPYLAPNLRVSVGVEGDPCAQYRGEQPCATILEVHRDPDGYVRFRAKLDGSGEEVELDNRNIARPWEVAHDDVDNFRAHVARVQAEEADVAAEHASPADRHGEYPAAARAPPPEPAFAGQQEEFTEYRAAMASKFDALEHQLGAMEERLGTLVDSKVHDLGATTASTLRALAGDVIRSAQGMDLQFAGHYADRYDDALFRRAEEYRGGGHRDRAADRHSRQDEKTAVPMRGQRGTDFAESNAS